MKPKKSLGQNFLKDEKIAEKIITAAKIGSTDFVVEIGPGQGALTEKISRLAKKLIAIEIDHNLAETLKKKFKNKKNVQIIEDDILKINLPKILEEGQVKKYKVIANIPYYITSLIIRTFLETQYPPQKMILMVQREVAERIVAQPGNMSLLSVSVRYYAQPEILFYVDKQSFFPVPEVDSAVIKITIDQRLTTDNKNKEEIKKFFRIVRAGFSAKRKTLQNNLASSFQLDKKEVEEKLKKIALEPNVRAQELSIEQWKKLSELFP